METACTFGMIVGVAMAIVGFALIIPELAIDSPTELLLSLLGSGRGNFFGLIDTHIREGWPETKLAAVLFYGGLITMVLAGIGFWIDA